MSEVDTHTISIAGSELSWEDVDARAKHYGFNRSKYTQYLYEKDINPNKKQRFKNSIVVFLLLLLILMEAVILLLVMI